MREVTRGKYKVCQSDYNNHVTIIEDGHMVFHANQTKPHTEEELLEYLDFYEDIISGNSEVLM